MSDEALRLVVGGVILLHGIAHVGALGALWWINSGRDRRAGGWTAARSWLMPSLGAETATRIAAAFWLVALVGFVLTALAFFGVGLAIDAWRPLGVASAFTSAAGIVLFLGTWPAFNALAAMAVNVAVVAAALMNWPPESVFRG